MDVALFAMGELERDNVVKQGDWHEHSICNNFSSFYVCFTQTLKPFWTEISSYWNLKIVLVVI